MTATAESLLGTRPKMVCSAASEKGQCRLGGERNAWSGKEIVHDNSKLLTDLV